MDVTDVHKTFKRGNGMIRLLYQESRCQFYHCFANFSLLLFNFIVPLIELEYLKHV